MLKLDVTSIPSESVMVTENDPWLLSSPVGPSTPSILIGKSPAPALPLYTENVCLPIVYEMSTVTLPNVSKSNSIFDIEPLKDTEYVTF